MKIRLDKLNEKYKEDDAPSSKRSQGGHVLKTVESPVSLKEKQIRPMSIDRFNRV